MNESSREVFRGFGAAPGRVSGVAHVLLEAGDTGNIPERAILVARIIHPHIAPYFFRVAGVVVEEGAMLQHATTLAREFGIPAIVGAKKMTETLKTGDSIEVDGTTGEIVRFSR